MVLGVSFSGGLGSAELTDSMHLKVFSNCNDFMILLMFYVMYWCVCSNFWVRGRVLLPSDYSKVGVFVTGPFVIVTEQIYHNNSHIWGVNKK